MRLYTFLKDKFNLTKSETREFLKEHEVLVDGITPTLLTLVDCNSEIKIDSIEYKVNKEEYVYLAYNKAVGVECTNNTNNPNSIINQVNFDRRIFCVGRLDKDSRGLIILTDDPSLPNLALNKDNHVEKTYICKTKELIDNKFIEMLKKPTMIDNKLTRECKAELIDSNTFKIILLEGMNRQIRKMCKKLGRTVIDLKRIKFGKYLLDIEENNYKLIKKEQII